MTDLDFTDGKVFGVRSKFFAHYHLRYKFLQIRAISVLGQVVNERSSYVRQLKCSFNVSVRCPKCFLPNQNEVSSSIIINVLSLHLQMRRLCLTLRRLGDARSRTPRPKRFDWIPSELRKRFHKSLILTKLVVSIVSSFSFFLLRFVGAKLGVRRREQHQIPFFCF